MTRIAITTNIMITHIMITTIITIVFKELSSDGLADMTSVVMFGVLLVVTEVVFWVIAFVVSSVTVLQLTTPCPTHIYYT